MLYGFLDLLPFNIAPISRPVVRVFHEIAGFQPNPGVDRWEDPDDPATAPHLADRTLGHVRRRDLLGIDLRKTVKLERVLKPFLETADGVGKTISVFLGQLCGRPPGAFLVRLQPDLF